MKKKEPIPRRRFSPEFKVEAVRMASSGERSVAEQGLAVEFSTDFDPRPTATEREMYARAQALA